MGNQESLVFTRNKRDFDRLVKSCGQLLYEGFYTNPSTVIPMGVVEFKRRITPHIPSKKALWVVGDRCFHQMQNLLPAKESIVDKQWT